MQLVQQTLDRAVQILQEELEEEAKTKELENQQSTPKRMPVPPNGAKPDNVRRSPIPKQGSGVPMARKKMWESNNIQKEVQPVKEEQKEMEQTTEKQSQIDQKIDDSTAQANKEEPAEENNEAMKEHEKKTDPAEPKQEETPAEKSTTQTEQASEEISPMNEKEANEMNADDKEKKDTKLKSRINMFEQMIANKKHEKKR
jgi:hypothetical protein